MMRSLITLTIASLVLGACAASSPRQAPATTPETVKAPPAVPKPPAKPKITSTQLLGQGGSWVVAQLGDPVFVRTDQSAHLWQYKNTACVLNVFLYTDESVTPRVLHFDARNTQGSNTDRDQCLSTLQD